MLIVVLLLIFLYIYVMIKSQDDLRQEVRAKLGMTQREAAKEIPIHHIYFNKWLSGVHELGELKESKVRAWLKD